ncbi:dethiobiotin synthase [Candidatus Mycalebacterium sp.]
MKSSTKSKNFPSNILREQTPNSEKPRFFVTGTDTGAGKTVVCAALARCFMEAGKTVSMIKPFQTGCLGENVTDADFVHRAMGKPFTPSVSSPYCLKEPLAPMVAAEIENTSFDIGGILEIVESESATHDAVIVEGAGGLLVPVKKDYSMADFASDLGFKTLIAARAGLGTINHTLLTVEAARARDLEIAGIVICGYPQGKNVCEETNLIYLRERGQKIAGIIPFLDGLDVEGGKADSLVGRNCRSFFTSDLLGSLDEKPPPA